MKILIVDDSRVMRMLVRRTLRQANIGEHDYEEADNGADALEKLKAFSADQFLLFSNFSRLNFFLPFNLAPYFLLYLCLFRYLHLF